MDKHGREIIPMVYTVPEMAILLNMTEWQVYQRVKKGVIPGVTRLDGKIRFLKIIINEWLGIDGGSATAS